MGCLMKNLPHEYYVLKIDGRVNSTHRHFMDAVRAGLRLKDEFPQHDIKVRSIAQDSSEKVMRDSVVH
jgi:hypothetical protein